MSKPKRALAPIPDYTVEVLGRKFSAVDMVRASFIVEKLRDQTGMGASEMGSQFPVRDGARVIGYVSYNGRVWAGRPEDAGTDRVQLVYDPGEKAHRDAYGAPKEITTSRVLRNPTDAENDAEYKRGWTEGLRMLQEDWRKAEAWEGGPYRDMDEPSWFDMGKADVISEHNVARRMR